MPLLLPTAAAFTEPFTEASQGQKEQGCWFPGRQHGMPACSALEQTVTGSRKKLACSQGRVFWGAWSRLGTSQAKDQVRLEVGAGTK